MNKSIHSSKKFFQYFQCFTSAFNNKSIGYFCSKFLLWLREVSVPFHPFGRACVRLEWQWLLRFRFDFSFPTNRHREQKNCERKGGEKERFLVTLDGWEGKGRRGGNSDGGRWLYSQADTNREREREKPPLSKNWYLERVGRWHKIEANLNPIILLPIHYGWEGTLIDEQKWDFVVL